MLNKLKTLDGKKVIFIAVTIVTWVVGCILIARTFKEVEIEVEEYQSELTDVSKFSYLDILSMLTDCSIAEEGYGIPSSYGFIEDNGEIQIDNYCKVYLDNKRIVEVSIIKEGTECYDALNKLNEGDVINGHEITSKEELTGENKRITEYFDYGLVEVTYKDGTENLIFKLEE